MRRSKELHQEEVDDLEKVIGKIAGFGVPGLVLVIAINATGLAGAAAITASLAALGPGGMIGGIITLGAIGVIADALAKYGFEAILKGVVKELYKRGETKETIKAKVEKYPVSGGLKRKLYDKLDELDNEEVDSVDDEDATGNQEEAECDQESNQQDKKSNL